MNRNTRKEREPGDQGRGRHSRSSEFRVRKDVHGWRREADR